MPACEEGAQRARPPPPQLVFNLPQLHRESLATAAAVPAPFAALGAFWWTAQCVGLFIVASGWQLPRSSVA